MHKHIYFYIAREPRFQLSLVALHDFSLGIEYLHFITTLSTYLYKSYNIVCV